jgi:putative DNA primase/helicase
MMQDLIDALQQCEITDSGEVSLSRSVALTMQDIFEDVCVSNGSIWTYEKGLWTRLDHQEMLSILHALNGKAFAKGDSLKSVSLSSGKVKGIYESLLLCRELRREGYFNDFVPGVAFLDGFLRLKDGKVVKESHSPEHRCTMRVEENIPDAFAEPTLFVEFLEELFKPDEDKAAKIQFIQEWVGAALCGTSTKYARAALMVGKGGNGKSLLASAISNLFPDHMVGSSSPARWDKEYNIAALQDVRLNVVSELPEHDTAASADLYKAVLSGDLVSARMPYGRPYSYKPRTAHLYSANSLPSSASGDHSYGFYRRWGLLSLNRCFINSPSRRDPREILETLKKERGVIIAWALQGAAALEARGDYIIPGSTQELEREWRADTDSVQDFIQSCCKVVESEDDYEFLKCIYDFFKEWAGLVGRRPMSNRALKKRLDSNNIPTVRRGGQVKCALNIRDRSDWSDVLH